MTSVGVIPARYGSSRFPGKALALLAGKPMIQWVYEQSLRSSRLTDIIVATDDERIRRTVLGFGGNVRMTSPHHRSGTDRVAEVARSIPCDIVVNIQGDQPFIAPEMVDEVVEALQTDSALPMATLMHPIRNPEDFDSPGVVKVVTDLRGDALYFSRSRIPASEVGASVPLFEHIGLYAYRREFLLKLAMLEPTPLESCESLEQLRVLEHGFRLRVVKTRCQDTELAGFSVDTPEDLARAQRMLAARGRL